VRRFGWIDFMLAILLISFLLAASFQTYIKFSSVIAALLVCVYLCSSMLIGWLLNETKDRIKGSLSSNFEADFSRMRLKVFQRNRGILVSALYLLITAFPFFYALEKFFAK
jgi:hypothetical protein